MTTPVACVIPAYDAARTLRTVVDDLRRTVPDAAVVIVDDGSRDDTAALARPLADVLVRFPRNRGKGVALRAGFATALVGGAATIVTLDADGQHQPAAVPRLLAALGGADLVIGTRPRTQSPMPLGRRITNALAAGAVSAIVHQPLADPQSGFRAIRRRVLEAIVGEGDRFEFETDFLLRAVRAGFRVASVPVPTLYGPPSHFRPLTDSMRVVRTIWRHRASMPD